MITVLLVNIINEVITRRYNTNSFDHAARLLVQDWMDGKFVWNWEDTNEKITPKWIEEYGIPTTACEPNINRETEVCSLTWHYCGETDGDDEIVTAYFVKSAPVEVGEWPTAGVA